MIAVVCDGVSSSTAGGVAAHVAADAAGERLRLPAGADPELAITEAFADARGAVEQVAWSPMRDPAAPSTTIVAATSVEGVITVAGLGDSRGLLVRRRRGAPVHPRRLVGRGAAGARRAPSRPGDARLARAHDHRLARRRRAPTRADRHLVPTRPARSAAPLLGRSLELVARTRRSRRARARHRRRARRSTSPHALADRAVAAGGRDNITVVVADISPTISRTVRS